MLLFLVKFSQKGQVPAARTGHHGSCCPNRGLSLVEFTRHVAPCVGEIGSDWETDVDSGLWGGRGFLLDNLEVFLGDEMTIGIKTKLIPSGPWKHEIRDVYTKVLCA